MERVAVKAQDDFTITTKSGKITDVGKKYCRVPQRADGYGYVQHLAPAGNGFPPQPEDA